MEVKVVAVSARSPPTDVGDFAMTSLRVRDFERVPVFNRNYRISY